MQVRTSFSCLLCSEMIHQSCDSLIEDAWLSMIQLLEGINQICFRVQACESLILEPPWTSRSWRACVVGGSWPTVRPHRRDTCRHRSRRGVWTGAAGGSRCRARRSSGSAGEQQRDAWWTAAEHQQAPAAAVSANGA
jgi:hypothetical protein